MGVLTGVLNATLTMATPLLIAALGETVVQCAGVVNVGLEGMMLIGALAATLGAYGTHSAVIGLFVAGGAGMLTALLFAGFAVRLAANQVVVGVVVNLLAIGLTGTVYRARFGNTGTFLSTAALPHVIAGLDALTLAALAAVPVLWWWLERTRGGLELRACGEQAQAADAAGIAVGPLRTRALMFGGAMAGLAGAFLSVGENNTFVPLMTNGRGFIALAIVTSGRWNPWGCMAAAIVFGFADALQFQGQALSLNVPHDILLALPYVVTLAILMTGGRWKQAPAGLGRPFRKA